MNLSTRIKLTLVKAAQATGTTEVDSKILDMEGYEGVMFFGSLGSANSGNYIKVQQDSDPAFATVKDLAGSKVVTTADGEVAYVDVYRPTERYIRASVIRAGATTITGDIYALQYDARTYPQQNLLDGVCIGVTVDSPDETTIV